MKAVFWILAVSKAIEVRWVIILTSSSIWGYISSRSPISCLDRPGLNSTRGTHGSSIHWGLEIVWLLWREFARCDGLWGIALLIIIAELMKWCRQRWQMGENSRLTRRSRSRKCVLIKNLQRRHLNIHSYGLNGTHCLGIPVLRLLLARYQDTAFTLLFLCGFTLKLRSDSTAEHHISQIRNYLT